MSAEIAGNMSAVLPAVFTVMGVENAGAAMAVKSGRDGVNWLTDRESFLRSHVYLLSIIDSLMIMTQISITLLIHVCITPPQHYCNAGDHTYIFTEHTKRDISLFDRQAHLR
jgi:hypothetical protein